MRIGPTSTAPATAQKLPTASVSSGDGFQAALESSSLQRVMDSAKAAAAAKPNSTATLTARSGGKPQRTQATVAGSAGNAATTVTAPRVEQVDQVGQQTATTDEITSGQASSNLGGRDDCGSVVDVASPMPAATSDLHACAVVQSDAQPPSATQQAAIAQTVGAAASPAQANPAKSFEPAGDAQAPVAAPTSSTTAPAVDPTVAMVVAQAPSDAFVLPASLPSAGATTGKAGNPLASKATQKNGAGPVEAKSFDLTNASDAQKSKPTEVAAGTNDSAQQHSQSDSQSAQHSQSDAAAAAAIMPKPVDGSAMQMVATHLAGSAPASSVASPAGTSAPHAMVSHADVAVLPSESDELAPASGLNTAKVLQSMGGTEMRVGMHSADFGNISIRASVSQQQMVARISLDHSDLGQAISAHTAAVQAKLGDDFGMNASIEVNHQGAPLGDRGDAQQREQRDFSRSAAASTTVAAETETGLVHLAAVSAGDGPRLDIRA